MPEEKIKKLDRLLSLLDPEETLTKTDFTNSFKRVVELILKIQERQEKAIQQLFSEHDRLSGDFKSHYTSNLSQLKEQVNSLFVGDQIKRIDGELKGNAENLKKTISDLINSKLNDLDLEVSHTKNTLFTETKRKKDEMDLHLKTLSYNGKLDAEKAITTFKEEYKKDIQELKDMLTKIQENRSRGGGPVKRYIQRWINLSASVNGSATTFTMPKDVVKVEGLLSTQFPQIWITSDFSFAGGVLTTNFTMQSGQSLIAVCEVLFYP